LGHKIGFTIRI